MAKLEAPDTVVWHTNPPRVGTQCDRLLGFTKTNSQFNVFRKAAFLPNNLMLFVGLFTLSIAISGLLGLKIGQNRAKTAVHSELASQQAAYAEQQAHLQSTLKELASQNEIADATSESLQAALEQSQRNLLDVRSKLRLYERIEGKDVSTGLGVDSVKMTSENADNQGELMVTVYQARGRGEVKGRLGLVLNGTRDGKPYQQIVHDAHSNRAPNFKFRFFEAVSVPLPALDMDVQSVEITVLPAAKPHKSFKYQLAWAGILVN